MPADPKEFLAQLERQHRRAERRGKSGSIPFFKPVGPGVHGYGGGGGTTYEGARVNRVSQDWLPGGMSADLIHRMDARLLHDRARDLARNNPHASGAIGKIVDNVVACGIKPGPRIEDEDQRGAVRKDWAWWATKEADITRRFWYYQLMRTFFREAVVEGESLMRHRILPRAKSRRRRFRYAVELIPARRLADDADFGGLFRDKKTGHEIRRGVEIDPDGAVVAYHIRPTLPHDLFPKFDRPVRIPAEEITHLFFPIETGQYRGFSLLASAVMWLFKLGFYTDNELTASVANSCWSGIIVGDPDDPCAPEPANGEEDLSPICDMSGNPIDHYQPGTFMYTQAGEFKEIEPKRPNSGAEAWIKLMWLSISMGLQVSYEFMTGDYSQTSFIASRAGSQENQRRFKPLQDYVISHFAAPAWEQWFRTAVVAGRPGFPSPTEFADDPDPWLMSEWQKPGWDWLDPKSALAMIAEIEAGTRTYEEVIGSRGGQWEDSFEQSRRERRKMGVDSDRLEFSTVVDTASIDREDRED